MLFLEYLLPLFIPFSLAVLLDLVSVFPVGLFLLPVGLFVFPVGLFVFPVGDLSLFEKGSKVL